MKSKPFVLLDRDGTIIRECHYLSDPNLVELLPSAAEGMQKMQEMGLGIAAITNQSAIGRGYFNLSRLAKIHQRLSALLAAEGVHLDGIYFCPHRPDETCQCRKPKTGMVERAAEELNFDLPSSYVIGDKPCDIELGNNIGATTFLVRTGYGSKFARDGIVNCNYVVDNLLEAATIIEEKLTLEKRKMVDAPRR